jgi:Protein of unknown function (DUF3106)
MWTEDLGYIFVMFSSKCYRNQWPRHLAVLLGVLALLNSSAWAQSDEQAISTASGIGMKKSILVVAEPLWVDLSPANKVFLKPFEKSWYTLTPVERKSWVTLANKVPKLSAPEQKKAAARVNEWAALTPEQRKLARANYRLAQNLNKDERTEQWQRYESMTPAQQAVLRGSGWTSNTAAKHGGSTTGLAKEAAQPIKDIKAKDSKSLPKLADAQKK